MTIPSNSTLREEDQEEVITETACFCFKTKKVVKKNATNISLQQHSLGSNLLEN